MPGTLDGVTVVDLSWGMAGPFATGQLADHGASVVRVEPPGGDPYREMVSRAVYDRGKRSIVLDLREPAGLEALHRLLEGADVLVESWQPGVADRLGLGYTTLHERYPSLVYCSISGYGKEGPDRERPGYPSLVDARMGLMSERQGTDGGPVYLGLPINVIGAGLMAVIGIIASLVVREDTGAGQQVDTSLVDGALSFLSMFWEELENLPDVAPSPEPGRSRRRLLVGSMLCGDGEFLGVHTGANGSHARLMEAMGLSDRVKPAPGNREKTVPLSEEEQAVIGTEVPRLFASQPRSYWLERLRAADVTAIPVLRQGEVFDEPQVLHNRATVEVDDPELGPVTQVGVAARMGLTPGSVRGPAPRVGEHTDELLAEVGYAPAEIEALRRDAVAG